jgi:hypothetical protein
MKREKQNDSDDRGIFGRLRSTYRFVAIVLLNTFLFALGVNSLAWLALQVSTGRKNRVTERYGMETIMKVYPGWKESEVTQLLSECWQGGVQFEPYLHFRETPRAGTHVNVLPAGFRQSTNQAPWPPDPKRFNVFVFGGSTAFGYGLPDHQTLASQLGVVLSRESRPDVAIYNFGRCYYQCTQERLLFEQLLLAGHVPQAAIFIDGLNDFFLADGNPAVSEDFMLMMSGEEPKKREGGVSILTNTATVKLINRLREKPQPPSDYGATLLAGMQTNPKNIESVVGGVCARYLRNRDYIERIARQHGVRTCFVWQPVPVYKYDANYHPFKAGMGLHWASKFGYEHMAALIKTNPQPASFIWAADIQDGVREALYVDAIHYSAPMCERLARFISAQVKDRRLFD